MNRKTMSALPAIFGIMLGIALFLLSARPAKAAAAYGYLLPTSSYEYLDSSAVSGWSAQAVCYAKNEIYARNGRRFNSTELQNWFNQQYWYTPIYTPDQFSDEMLNEYETANVAMLSSAEAALGTYTLDSSSYSYAGIYSLLSASAADDGSYSVNADTYIFADSNTRYLTESEIAPLTLQELCYARNEIYARRGYIFVSTELSDYFNSKNWYWGTVDASGFSESVFNSYETANIALLEEREYELSAAGYVLDQPGYSYSGIGSYSSSSSSSQTATASAYIFYDSAIRYLSDSEVSALSLQQICYARNEIYARRGYIFQSQELRDYFSAKSWYYPTIPADSFSDSVFNIYETANIALLRQYEYALNPNGYQLY